MISFVCVCVRVCIHLGVLWDKVILLTLDVYNVCVLESVTI